MAFPLEKKTLHDHDLLQIGKTLIRILILPAQEEAPFHSFRVKESWGGHRHEIPSIVEKAIQGNKLEKGSTMVKELSSEEYSDIDIDELVRQVELLEAQNAFTPPPPEAAPLQKTLSREDLPPTFPQEKITSAATIPPSKTEQPQSRQSLKDDYLKYLDDDTEIEIDQFMMRKGGSPPKSVEKKPPRIDLFVKFFLVILIITAIFFSYWYYMLLERSAEEEHKAARAVADISMALNYANFYQVKPQNQNWSDPEFLKSNLQAILSKKFHSMVDLDHQGRFNNTPYILRIYTSSDLTQF